MCIRDSYGADRIIVVAGVNKLVPDENAARERILSLIHISKKQRDSVAGSMPLFGEYYDIPFEAIKEISMAGINIGPWGKDFHKLTERVYKEDLYELSLIHI